ncbi:MAG: DUF262 domain-containing protein [Acidimicrobiia bacterium]|nr:DUF262 domain-containing protein [Acidimicrobiia bacterium]
MRYQQSIHNKQSGDYAMAVDVQQITGNAQPVIQLLAYRRYGLDFYQREYSWKEAQVSELIDDLAGRFQDEFDPSHERTSVNSYRPYFLGPIVTAYRDDIRYLVDGQQRITTLSLLLIYIRGLLDEDFREDAEALNSLIFSTAFGRKTFNIDVEERQGCMDAIFEGKEFDPSDEPESVRNLWSRYQTIVERFPSDLQGATLPYFTDWLQHRVILVDIGAPDQNMALEIFETMNDRGLRLSNTDMLKSYLLARVGNEAIIRDLNDSWRRRITDLTDAEKNADAEFVKAWLRGKYAKTQRERKINAAPGDFDIIGTAFHKWVRDNASDIGLKSDADYRRFVEVEFFELSGRYLQLLQASNELQLELEAVFYNASNGFTWQIPVILAAITPDDDDTTFKKKSALIAEALDIYVVRRMVNNRNFGYSTVAYTMFNLIKDVRNQTVNAIQRVLTNWLENEWEQLDGIRTYSLTRRNRSHIRYILARITAWLDTELGTRGTFADYFDRSRKHPFEVEHIWADKFDQHIDEFSNNFEFQEQRNKLGGLVLLPKDFNASYSDMPYKEKISHYYAQNPLAQSLHPMAYENNPSFRRLRETHRLAFQAYPDSFTKTDIESRQELYLNLAKVIWNPARLDLIARQE